jgi:hypothetical protein
VQPLGYLTKYLHVLQILSYTILKKMMEQPY